VSKSFSQLWYPGSLLASWIVFFVAQVTILYELPLTILAILFCLLLLVKRDRGEGILFFVGLSAGLIIEVGLGMVARTQHWEYASLFGVPFWLPLIWGYGFVVMRRLGNSIVGYFN